MLIRRIDSKKWIIIKDAFVRMQAQKLSQSTPSHQKMPQQLLKEPQIRRQIQVFQIFQAFQG